MNTRQAVKIALREIENAAAVNYEQDDLFELLDYEGGTDYRGHPLSHPVQYHHDSKEVTLKIKASRREKERRLEAV